MTFNIVCDRIAADKPYPALAKWAAEPYTPAWREFTHQWPYTTPCELYEHCLDHGIDVKLYTVEEAPTDSYYIISLGFFDFSIDYIKLLPANVYEAVVDHRIKLLFYYHEGDNPYRIKDRLDSLCIMWGVETSSYYFVSGNTEADKIPGFVYFPDHELLYYRRNKNVSALEITTCPREKDFTLLSRTHKWWRATIVADLARHKLLDNSYWSYNTQVTINDDINDNPIEIDTLDIRNYLTEFLDQGPYRCDELSESDHNNHSIVEAEHYSNSYCNIVLETHFDADQSGGTFLTEKTFKPIKHGQPFVIAGPPGSLAALRRLGYRTFDYAIDNSYDLITDNTERWLRLRDTIEQIKNQDLNKWFSLCLVDLEHNQQLFNTSKAGRLNMLLKTLKQS